jgi:hypothetical protein
MAHTRKDTLVETQDWAKHLRPWKKRKVAKKERRAGKINVFNVDAECVMSDLN